MGGAESDASATPDGGAGEGADGATDDAVDVMEEPVPCGAEKEICCNGTTCTDSALTCSDQFCLSCGVIPSLSPGCVNVARGIEPTALQTSPNNPLVNATDATRARLGEPASSPTFPTRAWRVLGGSSTWDR